MTNNTYQIDLNTSPSMKIDEVPFEDHDDDKHVVSTSIFDTNNGMHTIFPIDLNAPPLPSNDEQLSEDRVDHVQMVSTSQSNFHKNPVEAIFKEYPRSSVDAALFEETSEKTQTNDQGDYFTIMYNCIIYQ